MPVDPSISLGVKPVQPPNLLEMAMQGANLRNAQLSGNNLQQTMAAKQAVGKAIQDNTDPTTGAVDFSKVQSAIGQDPNAAFALQEATSTNQAQQQQQIANKQAQFELAMKQINQSAQTLGTLSKKDDLSTGDILTTLAQQVKRGDLDQAHMIGIITAPDFPGANATTKEVRAYTMTHLAKAQDASAQLAAMSPQVGMLNTGNAITPINTNPNANVPIGPIAVAAPIPATLSPGALETIETDAAGNKHVVSRSPQGTILSTRSMPGAVAPGGNGGSGFVTMTPGQPADIAAAQQEVGGVRSAGDQAPIQANINQNILRLSKDTTSAPGSARWQKAMAGFSLGKVGDSYQELGKFLEKNAIQAMQTMGGPPSDARLSAATAANGSTEFNPGALQAVTKFNDATTTALSQFRQGVDKAVGLKNSDYTALPAFKSAWAKNFDVNVFRVENAIRDNDTAELNKIKSELTKAQMKELAQKRLNLQILSTTGRLP